ncbi:dynamin family protein [Streptomyces sp. NPDC019890]|uniref:dynamin family protein n=1 Tax=Streptomyces sp. NPDC019890 TaxID=3365064 RepID=UPI00384C44F4
MTLSVQPSLRGRHTVLTGGAVMESMRWADLQRDQGLVRLGRLTDTARALVADAGIEPPAHAQLLDSDWLRRVTDRVSATLSVFVIGQVSSGKSSLINSLLGRRLLISDPDPTDGVIAVLNWLGESETEEYAERVWSDGRITRFTSVGEAVQFLRQEDVRVARQLACREVRFYLREPILRRLRLISTPGLGDRLQPFEDVTLRYLREDESDLVLWTFFPESAGNVDEIRVFAQELASRKGSVLGVLTRSLEDHEDDPAYDPHTDPEMAAVVGALHESLAAYLSGVVLYDSDHAHRLTERKRDDPALAHDTAFAGEVERCGHAALWRALEDLVGPDGEKVERARVSLLLRRCAGHAGGVADDVEAVKEELLRRAADRQKHVDDWTQRELKVVEPARTLLRDELQTVAAAQGDELARVLGHAAADAVLQNFKLIETLARSAVAWVSDVDSAAERLNHHIDAATERAVGRIRFWERTDARGQVVVDERLRVLRQELHEELAPAVLPADRTEVDPLLFYGSPGASAQGNVTNTGSGMAKLGLEVGASMVAGMAAKTAAKAAAEEAAKAGGVTAAKGAASVLSIVMAGFDVKKLIEDFGEGREQLAETVRSRLDTQRPAFAALIFDRLWASAQKQLNTLLAPKRESLMPCTAAAVAWNTAAEEANHLQDELTALASRFTERAGR